MALSGEGIFIAQALDAVGVNVSSDSSGIALSNAECLQNVADGNSGVVSSLGGVHVELAPGLVGPSGARTHELVVVSLDGDAHLGSEGHASLVDGLLGDESNVEQAIDAELSPNVIVSLLASSDASFFSSFLSGCDLLGLSHESAVLDSGVLGIISLVISCVVSSLISVGSLGFSDRAVVDVGRSLDLGAVLDQVSGQSVDKDLSSFATLDRCDSLPAVSQTSGQADLVGAVQDVDVPAGAGVAFLRGIEVQGGEHQLEELNASDLTLRSVGGSGHAISQAGDAAVVDVGQSPVAVAVDERILCVGVQISDVGLDLAVGSCVVDDSHNLSRLGTGEGPVSSELVLIVRDLEAVQDLEVGQDINSIGIVVGSLDIRVGRGTSSSDGAKNHDNRQNKCKNLLQILHLDFLLF